MSDSYYFISDLLSDLVYSLTKDAACNWLFPTPLK